MYEYHAKITSVYDGDGAFGAEIDLGLGIIIKRKIRLYGVDAPEMKTFQYSAGKVVRDLVRKLILDKKIIIRTKKDASGKYGRLLADIIIDDKDLSELLLSKGYVKPYFGGTKTPWTPQELLAIEKSSPDYIQEPQP